LDAATYSGSGSLLDQSGNGHDAQLGSTAGSDTNDPTFLAHTGTNFIRFHGNDTNRVDSNADLAGNDTPLFITYYARVAAIDWTPAAAADFIGSSSGYRTFGLTATNGYLTVSLDDGSARTATSSVAPTVADGATLWVKAVIDNAANTCDFSTSTEDTLDYQVVTWETLGTQQTITVGATLTSVTAFVLGGSDDTTGNDWDGDIYAAIVLYDGVEVARLVPADIEPARTALDLDGTNDYASVPDETALDITGDIELQVDIAADDWTPSLFDTPIAKSGTGGEFSYRMYIWTDGTLNITVSVDGTAELNSRTLAAPGFVNGSRHKIRVTLDLDDGSSNRVANFYIDDLFFETVTTAGVVSGIHAGTFDVRIGADNNESGDFAGQVFSAKITDGIGGTTVLDVDFTDQRPGAGTVTASTGQTVTLNNDAAIVPDGQLRIHDSTPTYLDLPGASGDYADSPDSAALSFSGDIEVVVRVALTDWTPGTTAYIGKAETSGTRSWNFYMQNNNGRPSFFWESGGVTKIRNSSIAYGFNDGQLVWLKTTLDVSAGEVSFYYSTEMVDDESAVTWTLHETPAALGAFTIDDNDSEIRIGTTEAANWLNGTVRRAIIKDGIGGTVVFDADFTGLAPGVTSFTEDSSNAATVTLNGNAAVAGGSNKWDVNRATSGLVTALVDRPMFVLDGTDDYLEIPNDLFDLDVSTTSHDSTAIIAHRTHNLATGTIFAKRDGVTAADAGWSITSDGSGIPTIEISDAVDEASDAGTAIIASALVTVGFTDTTFSAANEVELFQNGVGTGSPGNTDDVSGGFNGVTLQIGAESDGGVPWDGEFYAAAFWQRALTDAEILEASERMRGVYTVTDPELTVEIGFDANPLDTIIAWTDIVDDLQQLNLRRGRQFELNRFEAGTLTAIINNQDGTYDPENTGAGAPYNGNISPLKHVRVTAIDPSTPVGINNPVLFRGYTEGWEQRGHKVYTTTLTAADSFKALNLLPLGDNYLTEILKDNPLGAWKLNETFGTSISDASGNSGTGTITHSAYTLDQGSPFQNAFGGSSMAVTAGATTGWITLPEAGEETLHQSQDGAYTFEAMIKPDSGASARTGYLYVSLPDGTAAGGVIFGITSGGEVTVTMAGQGNTFTSSGLTDDVWNHLVVVIKDSGLSHVFVNGTNTSGALFNSGVSFADVDGSQENRLLGWNSSNNNPFQGTASTVAVYDHALKPARILAHYNATINGWPEQTLYDRFVSVLSYVNWPTLRQNLDTKTDSNLHLVAGDELTGESTLTYLASIAQSFGAEFFADTNGDLCLRSRDWRAENNTTTNTTVGDDPTSSEIGYNNIDLSADDQYTYTHVDATASNGRVFTVEGDDFNSATDLQRTFTAPSNRAGDDNIVQARVEWLAEVYQTTRTRIKTVSIPTRASAAALTQAVYREIGDRVTIKRRPPGGYIISFDAFIEAINHTIDNNLKRWNTTWQLSPAEPHISVLLVDTGIVGIGAVGEDVIGW